MTSESLLIMSAYKKTKLFSVKIFVNNHHTIYCMYINKTRKK